MGSDVNDLHGIHSILFLAPPILQGRLRGSLAEFFSRHPLAAGRFADITHMNVLNVFWAR
jgi:hypothetical protein